MSPSARQPRSAPDARALLVLMDLWPDSRAGVTKDKSIGRGLDAEFRPFVTRLREPDLPPGTVRRRLDNLWVMGGEIVGEFNYDPNLGSPGLVSSCFMRWPPGARHGQEMPPKVNRSWSPSVS
jgi:hypothetical protein